MKSNVGSAEKIIRIIAGLVLIGLAYSGILGVWAYIGVILVVTGLINWCPIWAVFGVNTKKESPASPE